MKFYVSVEETNCYFGRFVDTKNCKSEKNMLNIFSKMECVKDNNNMRAYI